MAREMLEDKSFCYTDVSTSNPTIHQTHLVNQIHTGFETNPEIFNLTTNMEMIGFFNKHHQGPSSSKSINESTTSPHDFYHHHQFNKQDFTTGMSEETSENHHHQHHQQHDDDNQNHHLLGGGPGPWQVAEDDSSLRCVFPCEGNERPSQGLSLSLSSTNPSTIGLQSFELRQTNPNTSNQTTTDDLRFGSSREALFFGKQQMLQQTENNNNIQFQLMRNSKYLIPAQELLNEFCSLGTKQNDSSSQQKNKTQKTKQWDTTTNDENASSSSSRKQSLQSLEFMELQKRKTKLLQMLEAVDTRYRHYCDQMKAVVSSFESVAGIGAAKVYSALASKAMSRHFRCLRDGIVSQIQQTKKAMGEKDPVAPGTTRGETPRLRILDQALRQQRAFQQMSMMETHPWRPQRGLPERSVSVLRAWLFEHFLHPYPSDVDKHILARQTGLSRSQVSNWFINARVRLWKPMVEEMYLEETREQENNTMVSSDGVNDLDLLHHEDNNINRPNQTSTDQKPTQDQLVRIDSECLSSIINNSDKNDNKAASHHHHHHQQQPHSFGSYGAMELDFSSYNHQHGGVGVSYSENANQSFNGGNVGNVTTSGGVSLTLGLQQHGGNGGVSLAFSPTTQSSLFYARDHIEDCPPVQYSLLDGEGQNLPYRNLMGAQLLHDLAG